MRAWGIDFHVYDNLRGHLATLADNGMSYAIFKVTMGYGDAPAADIEDFFNEISKTSLIPGVYGWIDPTGSVTDQVDRYGKIITTYKPKLVCADFEQWWSNWTEYYRFLNGIITQAQVPKIDKAVNSSFGKAYCAGIDAIKGNAVFQVYTNSGFVNSWAPTSVSWLCQNKDTNYPGYLLWDAGTPYYNTIVKFTDWPSFNAWLDNRPAPVGASIYGMQVKSRQITSQIWLPGFTGTYDNMDFNLWVVPGAWATQEQMRSELSIPIPPVDPPIPPPTTEYATVEQLNAVLSMIAVQQKAQNDYDVDFAQQVRNVLSQLAGDDQVVSGQLNKINVRMDALESMMSGVKNDVQNINKKLADIKALL